MCVAPAVRRVACFSGIFCCRGSRSRVSAEGGPTLCRPGVVLSHVFLLCPPGCVARHHTPFSLSPLCFAPTQTHKLLLAAIGTPGLLHGCLNGVAGMRTTAAVMKTHVGLCCGGGLPVFDRHRSFSLLFCAASICCWGFVCHMRTVCRMHARQRTYHYHLSSSNLVATACLPDSAHTHTHTHPTLFNPVFVVATGW